MRTRSGFSLTLAVAVAAAVCVGSAHADVELVHDKAFWSEALQSVAADASGAIGTEVTETAYSPPEQYKAFIQSSVASSDVPKLFTWWTGGVYEELVETGELAELDDLWEELIASGEFDQSTRDFYTVGEHVYGVPLHLSRWIALYNKSHFAEAGIEPPTTWQELTAAAETLKQAGKTPFLATTQDGWRGFIWFQELMLRTDPDAYQGLHTGEVAYDSEPVRKAFEIWSDWYAKGWFTDPRSNEEVADFARGNGSIYLMGDWAVGLIEAAGLEAGTDIGAFVMPSMDAAAPSAVIVEGSPIVMSNEGAADEQTMAMLKHFLSVDGANVWAEASGNSIGNTKANPPNVVVAQINDTVAAEGTAAFQRWWEAVPADLQGELVAEFNRFMLDPTMDTAESVMANAQSLNAEYWADQ